MGSELPDACTPCAGAARARVLWSGGVGWWAVVVLGVLLVVVMVGPLVVALVVTGMVVRVWP